VSAGEQRLGLVLSQINAEYDLLQSTQKQDHQLDGEQHLLAIDERKLLTKQRRQQSNAVKKDRQLARAAQKALRRHDDMHRKKIKVTFYNNHDIENVDNDDDNDDNDMNRKRYKVTFYDDDNDNDDDDDNDDNDNDDNNNDNGNDNDINRKKPATSLTNLNTANSDQLEDCRL
jgi:hypothetical protein